MPGTQAQDPPSKSWKKQRPKPHLDTPTNKQTHTLRVAPSRIKRLQPAENLKGFSRRVQRPTAFGGVWGRAPSTLYPVARPSPRPKAPGSTTATFWSRRVAGDPLIACAVRLFFEHDGIATLDAL